MVGGQKMQGFSLVELSIVLVILGLLIGGILTGQSLIKAAELRSVTIDLQKYQTAITSFRDKYLQLPGDMNNAVRFWSAQAGGTVDGADATCVALTVGSTDQTTCNGNGNGQIAEAVGVHYEAFRAWQHLANAGMIEGRYNGVSNGAAGTMYESDANAPRSKIGSGHFMVRYIDAAFSTPDWYVVSKRGHLIAVGSSRSPLGGATQGAAGILFRPEEAWNIDTKMDDGLPAQGGMHTFKTTGSYNTGCTTTDVAATAVYNLTNSSVVCHLYMLLGQ